MKWMNFEFRFGPHPQDSSLYFCKYSILENQSETWNTSGPKAFQIRHIQCIFQCIFQIRHIQCSWRVIAMAGRFVPTGLVHISWLFFSQYCYFPMKNKNALWVLIKNRLILSYLFSSELLLRWLSEEHKISRKLSEVL